MNHAATDSGRPANRLAAETSPYLLQHKHNPVDWWPWGPEALAEAQRSNRPILLSIGYAACHWCHVMAHESFENPETAALMNAWFLNIKVDREERPDIDQIYMSALHHLGEQGGWPLTMFLSSDGSPFWGGTYFPKLPDFGRPAFTDVLQSVAGVFRDQPDKIAHHRDVLVARLSERAKSKNPANLGVAELNSAAASIAHVIDPVNGGLQGAPKFPQCSVLEFLWRAGARANDDRFFAAVTLTLTRMSQGGLYDHLGGGYARYSVDDRWLVPHFEKMLYDNAQILDLLALDYARSANPLYRERAIETVDWLRREMLTTVGGFASSLDADSDGKEGKFYVWSLKEIEEVLGATDASDFAARYDITARGNFEGYNILNRLKYSGLGSDDDARMQAIRQKLLARRESRVRPSLDDKVLADWNGLMIAALVHAARVFDKPDWLQIARTAFEFVLTHMTRDERLGHSWREGRLLIPALASDYAAMGRAALALFEATGDNACLEQALRWQSTLDTHYADVDHGGYYLTADDAEGLIVRPHSTDDDAIPNHDGLIAQNMVRLAALTGNTKWRDRIDRLFVALLPNATEKGFGQLSLMNALDLRLTGAEIVVVGEGAQADALLSAARKLPHATSIVMHASHADALPADHPAHIKANSVQGAAAFVCRNQSCSLPAATIEQFTTLVKPAPSIDVKTID